VFDVNQPTEIEKDKKAYIRVNLIRGSSASRQVPVDAGQRETERGFGRPTPKCKMKPKQVLKKHPARSSYTHSCEIFMKKDGIFCLKENIWQISTIKSTETKKKIEGKRQRAKSRETDEGFRFKRQWHK
jgi:hypothetical protein